jgi:uncharacterized small protein (DUF1192 family)
MSDDLLKRRLIGTGHGSSFEAVRRIDEMADELTRLRAEVERLREAERTAWERGQAAAADIIADFRDASEPTDNAVFCLSDVRSQILALTPEASHD